MKLEAGRYWGEQIVQRQSAGVCLTLCRYEAGRCLPWHSHENAGFFFLLFGDHEETNHRRIRLQPPSSLLFHGSDCPHETEVGPRGMIGLNVAFQSSWLHEWEVAEPREKDGWLLEKPLAKRGALKMMAALSGAHGIDVESTGLELLELIGVCGGALEKQPPHWLLRVRERIESDYMQPLSLTKLAYEVSVHPVYLARAFRKGYRCTVTAYLHHVRMCQALARICAGVPLGQVAAECGFCDQAHLARVARTKLGVAPSAFNWFRSSKPSSA